MESLESAVNIPRRGFFRPWRKLILSGLVIKRAHILCASGMSLDSNFRR
jgi:hypothetical protein